MSSVSRSEIRKTAIELARLLGETTSGPIEQIRRTIQVCGIDYARQIYAETLEIEAQGGLMLPDNSRRRTPGGVYFYLVRKKVTPEQRVKIFPNSQFKKRGLSAKPQSVPLSSWAERLAIIEELNANQGEIISMKIWLSGRPGEVEKRPEVVITTMSHVATMPNLPSGIPIPPTTPTLYTVYMTPKQWASVEVVLENPEDKLQIEGTCAPDPESNGMAIFVAHIRSELSLLKQHEGQKAVVQSDPSRPPKPVQLEKPTAEPVAAKNAPTPAVKPPKKSRFDDVSSDQSILKTTAVAMVGANIPPEFAAKLNELYASASLFKQKLETIAAKPKGQQFGLEMTQKLLKSVQDEIAAIEGKFKK